MKRVLPLVMVVVLLAGCAETSGIVKTGQDSYLLSKRGATGWSPIESLRVDILQQAGAFCVHKANHCG